MANINEEELNRLLNLVKTAFLTKEDSANLLQNTAVGSFSFNEKSNCKTLTFTQEEINKMPKAFKKEFRTDGCTARIYKRKSGKSDFLYDIKYRRNGYNVVVTDANTNA